MSDNFFWSALTAVLIAGTSALIYWSTPHNAEDDPAVDFVVVPDLTPNEQRGRKAFERSCVECHGVNGAGTDKGPPFLHRVYHPGHHADGAFFLAVKNGVRRHHWSFGDMPAQPHLTNDDIAAIIAFVRALQRANGYAPQG